MTLDTTDRPPTEAASAELESKVDGVEGLVDVGAADGGVEGTLNTEDWVVKYSRPSSG